MVWNKILYKKDNKKDNPFTLINLDGFFAPSKQRNFSST